MSKNDEFGSENEELCIENEEFCTSNDDFCRHIIGDPKDKKAVGLDRAMTLIGNVRLSLSAQAVGISMWVLDYLRETVTAQCGNPITQIDP